MVQVAFVSTNLYYIQHVLKSKICCTTPVIVVPAYSMAKNLNYSYNYVQQITISFVWQPVHCKCTYMYCMCLPLIKQLLSVVQLILLLDHVNVLLVGSGDLRHVIMTVALASRHTSKPLHVC